MDWMAQADPSRKASTVKKWWTVANALNRATHYFKKWTTASGVLKKIYFLCKNLMFQIDPLNSSCSQKLQYPERTVLFWKSPLKMYLVYLKVHSQVWDTFLATESDEKGWKIIFI